MSGSPTSPLLKRGSILEVAFTETSKKLSLFFASLCVIDLFGVFPIITLPKSLISCGLYGLPLLLFVITIQIYTAVVLGKCWIIAERICPEINEKNRYPYSAIAELTYGKSMKILVTILLDLTVFGAGIPNLLVASQNLQLLGLRLTDGEVDFSFCYFLIIIGIFLCPIMFLGSPKNMRFLASVSVIICTSVAVITWICVLLDSTETMRVPVMTPQEKIDFLYKPPFLNLLKAYGIIAFQFDLHPNLLTVQVDMAEKKKIGQAVCHGIFATCTFSLITTALVYYKYGTAITANVLEALPANWLLYIVILLVTLQLCLSSVIGTSALFQHIEDMFNISRKFNVKRCFIRSLLVWTSVLIGEFIPRFDLIMGIIGGTLTGPLIFILPPLFYTKMLELEKRFDERNESPTDQILKNFQSTPDDDTQLLFQTSYGTMESIPEKPPTPGPLCRFWKSECLLAGTVILFGLFATFSSTYYNIFDLKSFDQFWSPCIRNISLSYTLIEF